MKKILLVFALCLMLLLTACGQDAPTGEQVTQPTPATQTEEPGAADGLTVLREKMDPPVMAYANLGYPEATTYSQVMDYLWKEYPNWMEETEFIAEIPEERLVITCEAPEWAFLVCVVPRDPAFSLKVTAVEYIDEGYEVNNRVVYESDRGDPVLILCDTSDVRMIEVAVKDRYGTEVCWFPYWDYCNVKPESDYRGHHVMSFTPNSEKSAYQLAMDAGYYVPALDELKDGFWLSDYGYGLELLEDAVPGDNGGEAKMYDVGEYGEYIQSHSGSWSYEDGDLHLCLVPLNDGEFIDNTFPVLMDSWGNGWLWIGRDEYGIALPKFPSDTMEDVLDRPKG